MSTLTCKVLAAVVLALAMWATPCHAQTVWETGVSYAWTVQGGLSALPAISGASMNPGSTARVYDSGLTVYQYKAVFSGTTVNNSPYRISPSSLQAGGHGSGVSMWELLAVSGATIWGKVFVVDTRTITATKVGEWDTAYTWGDHSTIGYLMSGDNAQLSSVSTFGVTVFSQTGIRSTHIDGTGVSTTGVTVGTIHFPINAAGAAYTYMATNDSVVGGIPQNDGFRIGWFNNLFGVNNDGLLIEKIDGNNQDPDGGIMFGNTGNDGMMNPAMSITGSGQVLIGTTRSQVNGVSFFVTGGRADFETGVSVQGGVTVWLDGGQIWFKPATGAPPWRIENVAPSGTTNQILLLTNNAYYDKAVGWGSRDTDGLGAMREARESYWFNAATGNFQAEWNVDYFDPGAGALGANYRSFAHSHDWTTGRDEWNWAIGFGQTALSLNAAGVQVLTDLDTNFLKATITDSGTTEVARFQATPAAGGGLSSPVLKWFGGVNDGSTDVYNISKSYAKFDANNWSSARFTISTPTGIDTWTDVLTLKDGKVSIGTTTPNINTKLDVQGIGSFTGVSTSGITVFGTGSFTGNIDAAGYQIGGKTILDVPAGNWNIAVGQDAGLLSTGNYNTFLGCLAGSYTDTGQHNTYAGYMAGYMGGAASYNTALGLYAGKELTIGNSNVLIGYKAGENITHGDYNLIVGYDIDAPAEGTDYYLNIGNVFYGNLSTKIIGLTTGVSVASTGVTIPPNSGASLWFGTGGAAVWLGADGELWAKDNAGNNTIQTPHNKDGDWVFNSNNTKTSSSVFINMIDFIKDFESVTGKRYIFRSEEEYKAYRKDE